MGTKMPTNEDIHIGDIYESHSTDECGHSCAFYQVVGKRAKTLVELRAIQDEAFVDESCHLEWNEVKVRPLPGQFREDREPFTVRPRGTGYSGKKMLRKKDGPFTTYYYELREGEVGHRSGFPSGVYELNKLKKEGKLPPWASK